MERPELLLPVREHRFDFETEREMRADVHHVQGGAGEPELDPTEECVALFPVKVDNSKIN